VPLLPGYRLGPYEILAPIGAGGMGEVYKARDSKLERDVAIKVLPAALARDPERLARFEREAKVLASLNHPNIAQIYGIEESDTGRALVMELVLGHTLKGPLPLNETLDIARQVAEALEAAHDKGIVHRDLKPANIMITPAGVVKVFDFGLAAVKQPSPASGDPNDSPTLTMGATQAGMILGTAGYMSPEQAAGQFVDKRADIWSFGVVVWELFTGQRLFRGDSVAHILADVLRTPIDFDKIPLATPRVICNLLKRCLDRDVRTRLRDIGEARIAIENVDNPMELPAIATRARRRRSWLLWCIAGLLLLALIPANVLHFRETPPADPVLHLSVPLPANSLAGFVALSPDGRRLVIPLATEGKANLWLRALDSPRLQLLPGTDSARAPFWSPDGKSIGFFADGKLKIIAEAGGPAQVLCDGTGAGAGGTWNRDGVILFSTSGPGDPLQRVSASGGTCTPLARPKGGGRHAFPEFLPDGKHFIYVLSQGDEAQRGIYVASLDSGIAPRRLLTDVSSAIFAPYANKRGYGYLLFLRGNALVAQMFNTETLQLSGDPIRMSNEGSFSFNAPQIAASASGEILAYATNLDTRYQLTWLDRSGKELSKVGTVQDQRGVGLSPDEKTVATVRRAQGTVNLEMWLYNMQRGGETRFTSVPRPVNAPVWSPDGKWIVFGSGKSLYVKDTDGGSKEELLLQTEMGKTPSDWSRDGRFLIYTEIDPKGQGDIWFLPGPLDKSSGGKPVKFQSTEADESQGQLSPDGRWLAYVSNESGQSEVYVRPFPAGPGRWKVSAGRGYFSREPRWRRDGKELFFLETPSINNRLIAVPVHAAPGGMFQVGAPEVLFEFRAGGIVPTFNTFLYSPSADGQRFLVDLQPADATPILNVISNWEKASFQGE
jgi:eukaryotic-like serine/threonine-protein kinase